jgi:SagB-type dehydrogenase family enzyme
LHVQTTLSYHQQTKHHLHRYARSLGYLDWATQPDPFRTYQGAPRLDLPLPADGLATSYSALYVPGTVTPRPLDRDALAILFELSLGLSAWKQFRGTRWALRCNPSSGNLHPTEGYVLVPAVAGLEPGLYHYVSRDHCLERRCLLVPAAATQVTRALLPGSFLVGLSSIHWREAWKYGERAFRYCQHDAGHALATVRYAAAALGWSARLLDSVADDDIAAVLGLDRDGDFAGLEPEDREHPDALILVSTGQAGTTDLSRVVEPLRRGQWTGKANPLSSSHVHWDVIDEVAGATWKPRTNPQQPPDYPALPSLAQRPEKTASTIIRQRRSCLGLDGKTGIGVDAFYRMLDHLLPRPGIPPWDVLPWRPHLHAALFVHRVRGLKPGLYFFARNNQVDAPMRAATRQTFLWQRPAGCPDHLRLYCLAEVDLREAARVTSCLQEIASDGAFSLGMIAEFGEVVRTQGPWWYRRLFWESGVLGQVLYLEAEAAGMRGTGIGCYFDDTMHDLLGLQGDQFQSLYHFTVGKPVDDPRLTTLPPYAHLQRSASE